MFKRIKSLFLSVIMVVSLFTISNVQVMAETISLTPVADTFITAQAASVDKNFAKGVQINVSNSADFRVLMRFTLPSNLNMSNVTDIKLKLYSTAPSTTSGRVLNVFKITNITWEEGTGLAAGTSAVGIPGITHNKAIDSTIATNYIVNPNFTTPLATTTLSDATTGLMVATIPASAITQADVTAGAVSFIVKGNLSNNWYIHSKESLTTASRPILEIVSASSLTTSFSPAINGFVSSDNATATLDSTTLRVQNKDKGITLLKFDVTGITNKVISAKLTLKPSTLPVSPANINVYATEEMAGDGSSLSYTTDMPHIWNMTTLASLGVTSSSTSPIVVDLSSVITKNGTYYLALKSNSSEVVEFSSSADSTPANRPNLVVEYDQIDTSEAVYTPKLYKSSYYKVNGINVYNGNNTPASLTNEIKFKNETGNAYTFKPIVAAYKGDILEAVSIGETDVTVTAGSVASPYSSGVISIPVNITENFDTVKTFMWEGLNTIKPIFNDFVISY